MRKFILFFATGGGAGYFPKIPGTAGSVVGVLLFYLFRDFTPWLYGVTTLTLIFFAVWVSDLAEGILKEKDPQKVVIDEVVGILVSLSLMPFQWKIVVAGFFLFRLFDIWKPFPARLFQNIIPGGWGVVADDVMAGIYANLVLQILIRVHAF